VSGRLFRCLLGAALAQDGCWRAPPQKNFLVEPGDLPISSNLSVATMATLEVFLILAIYFLLFEPNHPSPSVGVCRRLPNQFFNVAMIESCCAAEKGAG
jgi:hypothetical protein